MALPRLPSKESNALTRHDSSNTAYFQDYWSENSSDSGLSQGQDNACTPLCGNGGRVRGFQASVVVPPPAPSPGHQTGQFTTLSHPSQYETVTAAHEGGGVPQHQQESSLHHSSVCHIPPGSQCSPLQRSAVDLTSASAGGHSPSGYSRPQQLPIRDHLSSQANSLFVSAANGHLVTQSQGQAKVENPTNHIQPTLAHNGDAGNPASRGTGAERPETKKGKRSQGKKAGEGASRGKGTPQNTASKTKGNEQQPQGASGKQDASKQKRTTLKRNPAGKPELAGVSAKSLPVGDASMGAEAARGVAISADYLKRNQQEDSGVAPSPSEAAVTTQSGGEGSRISAGISPAQNLPGSSAAGASKGVVALAHDITPGWGMLPAEAQHYSATTSQQQREWRSLKESVRENQHGSDKLAGEGVFVNKVPRQILPSPPNPALCVNTERPPSRPCIDIKFRLLSRQEPRAGGVLSKSLMQPMLTTGITPRSKAASRKVSEAISRKMSKATSRRISKATALPISKSDILSEPGVVDSEGKVRFRVFQVKRPGEDRSSLVAYKWLNHKRSPQTAEDCVPLSCNEQCGGTSTAVCGASEKSVAISHGTGASKQEGGLSSFVFPCASTVSLQIPGCMDSVQTPAVGDQGRCNTSCLPTVEAPQWCSQGQVQQCSASDNAELGLVASGETAPGEPYQLSCYGIDAGQYCQFGDGTPAEPVESWWTPQASAEDLQMVDTHYMDAEAWSQPNNGEGVWSDQFGIGDFPQAFNSQEARRSSTKLKQGNLPRASLAQTNPTSSAAGAVTSSMPVNQTESRASRAHVRQRTSQQLPSRKATRVSVPAEAKEGRKSIGEPRHSIGIGKRVSSTSASPGGASTSSPARVISFAPASYLKRATSKRGTVAQEVSSSGAATAYTLVADGGAQHSPQSMASFSRVEQKSPSANMADVACSSWQCKPLSCCEKTESYVSAPPVSSCTWTRAGTTANEQQVPSPAVSSEELDVLQQVPAHLRSSALWTGPEASQAVPPARTTTAPTEYEVPVGADASDRQTKKEFSLKSWLVNSLLWSACRESDNADTKKSEPSPEVSGLVKEEEEGELPQISQEQAKQLKDEAEHADDRVDVFPPHQISRDKQRKDGSISVFFREIKRRQDTRKLHSRLQDSRSATAILERLASASSVSAAAATKPEDELMSLLSAATIYKDKPEPVFLFRVIQSQQAKDREWRRLVAFRPPVHVRQPPAPYLPHTESHMANSQGVHGDSASMRCVVPSACCRSASVQSDDSIVTRKYEHRTSYVPLATRGKTLHVVTHHGVENATQSVLRDEQKTQSERLLCVSSFAVKMAREAAERMAVRQAIKEARGTGSSDRSGTELQTTEETELVETDREEEVDDHEEPIQEYEFQWEGTWRSIAGAAELFCCSDACASQTPITPSTRREAPMVMIEDSADEEDKTDVEVVIEEGQEETEDAVEEGGKQLHGAVEEGYKEAEQVIVEGEEGPVETLEQQGEQDDEVENADSWCMLSSAPESVQRGSCTSCCDGWRLTDNPPATISPSCTSVRDSAPESRSETVLSQGTAQYSSLSSSRSLQPKCSYSCWGFPKYPFSSKESVASETGPRMPRESPLLSPPSAQEGDTAYEDGFPVDDGLEEEQRQTPVYVIPPASASLGYQADGSFPYTTLWGYSYQQPPVAAIPVTIPSPATTFPSTLSHSVMEGSGVGIPHQTSFSTSSPEFPVAFLPTTVVPFPAAPAPEPSHVRLSKIRLPPPPPPEMSESEGARLLVTSREEETQRGPPTWAVVPTPTHRVRIAVLPGRQPSSGGDDAVPCESWCGTQYCCE
ncbi:hypothetical protein TGPRC2_225690 [Toxoplasma gondii TgCatPRC2]|uniref:Uncharacterized protein n=1 Tax=Toxoplasma gondii TgCatPRC2 TaxID=1130821 RepID=A0A151HRD1_TOXGO|nr:hypothetical protein TGPRC2_225690 [Toxoplasma gondii TgCatPRC2]